MDIRFPTFVITSLAAYFGLLLVRAAVVGLTFGNAGVQSPLGMVLA
jgi:hypothetical protein